jgi:hypothetical protein
MAKVTNISNGPRGAYNEGVLVMADPGETIEADDFAKEWFANASSAAAKDAAEEAAAPEEAPSGTACEVKVTLPPPWSQRAASPEAARFR